MSATAKATFATLFSTRLTRASAAILERYARQHALDRPLFLIGLNRSGTTLLMRRVAATRALVNWSEANELWDPLGYPSEADRLPRPPWPLDPYGYTASVLESLPEYYKAAIPGLCALRLAAEAKGNSRARFFNKCPMNTLRTDFLRQTFPGASFLSIVRDPRAVIRSWTQKVIPKLERHPRSGVETAADGSRVFVFDGDRYEHKQLIDRMAQSWVEVVSAQLEVVGDLPKERVYHLRYEDLVEDVAGHLERIDQRFDLDPAARQWNEIPSDDQSRNLKVKREWSGEEMAIVEARCEALMVQLGYR